MSTNVGIFSNQNINSYNAVFWVKLKKSTLKFCVVVWPHYAKIKQALWLDVASTVTILNKLKYFIST